MSRISLVTVAALFVIGCGGSAGAPTALFTAPPTATPLLPISFDASASTDPGRQALAYHWDFGDGAHGGTATIAHAFAASGTFTVTLTVTNANGRSARKTASVAVAALATVGAPIPVLARVFDSTGAPLAGVTVSATGVAATSNASGQVTAMIPGGRVYNLALTLSGYATQFHVLDLTAQLQGSIYFEATMTARDAAAPFDAEKGGTLTARDGATIILPPNALVDATGKRVTGAITIAMTAVNPRTSPGANAFPGQYVGITPDAKSNLLVSYGTTEYALYQGSNRLQLASGATATIETPSYANRNADGSTVKAGDTIPLWSLDENTGSWTEEGTGTVVTSTASPTGLALHAEVSHFSWWNCDAPQAAGPAGIQCQCETDEEVCAIIGMAAFTCQLSVTPGDSTQSAVMSFAQPAPAPASFSLQYNFAVGAPSQSVLVPVGVSTNLVATALGGTLTASQSGVVLGPGGQSNLVFSLHSAVSGATQTILSDNPVTLPYADTPTLPALLDVRRYEVTVPVGGQLNATFSPTGFGSAGVISILDSGANTIAKTIFDAAPASVSTTAIGTAYTIQIIAVNPSQGALTIYSSTKTDENIVLPFDRTDAFAEGDVHAYHFAAQKGVQYRMELTPSAAVLGTFTLTDPSAHPVVAPGSLDSITATTFVAAQTGAYVASLQPFGATSIEVSIVASATPTMDGGVVGGVDAGTSTILTPPFTLPPFQIPPTSDSVFSFLGAPGQIVLLNWGGPAGVTMSVGPAGQPPIISTPAERALAGGVNVPFAADVPGTQYNIDFHNPTGSGASANLSVTLVPGATTISPSPDIRQGFASEASPAAFVFPATAGQEIHADVFSPNLCVEGDTQFFFDAQLGTADAGQPTQVPLRDGAYQPIPYSGNQVVVYPTPEWSGAPCAITYGVNVVPPATNNTGDVLDFSLNGGANNLGQQQGAYFTFPSPGGNAVSVQMVITSGSAACSADVRVPGLPMSYPAIGLYPAFAHSIQSAGPGRGTVQVISQPTGSCAGSIYVQPVASPTPIAIPASPSPQVTLVDVGQHIFYSFVGDGSTGKLLHMSASPATALGNVTISAADGVNPFWSCARYTGVDGVCCGNGGTLGGFAGTGTLTTGKTFYVEVYGSTSATAGNVPTTITWYIE